MIVFFRFLTILPSILRLGVLFLFWFYLSDCASNCIVINRIRSCSFHCTHENESDQIDISILIGFEYDLNEWKSSPNTQEIPSKQSRWILSHSLFIITNQSDLWCMCIWQALCRSLFYHWCSSTLIAIFVCVLFSLVVVVDVQIMISSL